jgi:hypothetical protein
VGARAAGFKQRSAGFVQAFAEGEVAEAGPT